MLLKSSAPGTTAYLECFLKGIRVTLTVVGGGTRERAFATKVLVPILVQCVTQLGSMVGQIQQVHVTYCNACPARVLPNVKGTVITSENVNGGICAGVVDGVLVFRRQDAAKVLIHELLHLYGVDAPLRGLSHEVAAHVARPVRGMWGRLVGSLPTHLSEAYTDALACLVFCGDNTRAKACAVAGAGRVLAHFGAGRAPFLEETHVFAYYVIKAAMLVHADAFVTLLRTLKTPLVPSSPAEVTRLVEFMDVSLRSRPFRAAMLEGMASAQMSSPALDSIASSSETSISMTDGLPGRIQFSQLGVLI